MTGLVTRRHSTNVSSSTGQSRPTRRLVTVLSTPSFRKITERVSTTHAVSWLAVFYKKKNKKSALLFVYKARPAARLWKFENVRVWDPARTLVTLQRPLLRLSPVRATKKLTQSTLSTSVRMTANDHSSVQKYDLSLRCFQRFPLLRFRPVIFYLTDLSWHLRLKAAHSRS